MNNRITKTLRAKAGFTLVELIVVIAILGILAGVGTVGYSGYIKKANEAADQQLLGFVNQAFAAACIENGDDINNVTSATLFLNGDKTVEKVSLYNEEFAKYFADNASSAFQVFTSIVFDKDKHLFMDAVSAGYTAYDFGDGVVYISPADAAALRASTFITATDLGVDGLLDKVDSVTAFAAAFTDSNMMDKVFKSEGFKTYLAKALEVDLTAEDAEMQMELKFAELLPKMMEADPTLTTQAEAMNQLKANVAVLYAANNTASMSDEEIVTLLSGSNTEGNIKETLKTDPAKALSQAAIAYGMYTAYAYNSEDADLIKKTENPVDILTGLDDPAFQEYMKNASSTDLQGYLAAMNMINSSSNDTDAVSKLIVSGFNDEDLKAIIKDAVE